MWTLIVDNILVDWKATITRTSTLTVDRISVALKAVVNRNVNSDNGQKLLVVRKSKVNWNVNSVNRIWVDRKGTIVNSDKVGNNLGKIWNRAWLNYYKNCVYISVSGDRMINKLSFFWILKTHIISKTVTLKGLVVCGLHGIFLHSG